MGRSNATHALTIDARWGYVKELLGEGMTNAQIAHSIGVPRHNLHQYLLVRGIDNTRRSYHRWTSRELQEIWIMCNEKGMTRAQAARRIGTTEKSVKMALLRAKKMLLTNH